MRLRVTSIVVLAAGGFLATPAAAQHACCRIGDCVDVASEAACNVAGGFFLANQTCAADACGLGACCSPLGCFQATAFECLSEGRDFAGAHRSCLTDPCGGQVGACCHGGGCSPTTLPACDTLGGGWLGGGTSCASGLCDVGACCAPGSCQQLNGFDCLNAGGAFRAGEDCGNPNACDTGSGCPLDAMLSRPPAGVNQFTAGISESSLGVARFDDFDGANGAIASLTWWGLDLSQSGGQFVECVESDNTFIINLHANDAGTPGLVECSYTVVATRTPTGRVLGGFKENRYRATLPTPCPLTHGWISIIGAGDPQCHFLWVSTPEVDDRSYCNLCDPPNQPFDLSFCLGGTGGGVSGACCDESTGNCADDVDIAACAATGQRFDAGATCAELSPGCAVETGACCRPDGSCGVVTPDACVADGGRWLGAGASCELCPKLGGCCVVPGNCILDTAQDCAALGRTFAGEGTTCADCPPIPTCHPDAVFGQFPDGPDFFVAYQSESGQSRRFEHLPGLAGTVTDLTWWGLDLEPLGGGAFRECAELSAPFTISFHEDAAGVPGELVCTYTLTPTYTPTIHRYGGTTLNEYTAALPAPCVVRNPWVSLVGGGSPTCQFYWMSAPAENGSHFCEGCLVEFSDFDLNVCVSGQQGGVSGACCDGPSAACAPGIDIADCTGSLERFIPGGACGDFDPPCGVMLGACCFAQTASCASLTQVDCAAQQGLWLGANSICSRCPCAVACPEGGVDEGEVTCFDDYEDVYNSGCSGEAQAFTPLSPGDSACGEGGVHALGEEFVRDIDWYVVETDLVTRLTWSVEATFPFQAWIIDGRFGCPGSTLTTNAALECAPLSISTVVSPGTYWLVVGAIAQTDSSACGSARYTGTVTVSPPNGGDVDGDGDIDLDDYEQLADCLFGPEVQPAPAPPSTGSQCLTTFDFDVDGDVDLADFAWFARVGGSTPTLRSTTFRSSAGLPHAAEVPRSLGLPAASDRFGTGTMLQPVTSWIESTPDGCGIDLP